MTAKTAALFCMYLLVIFTSFKKYCLGSFAHSLLDSFWIFDRPVSLVLFSTIEQDAVDSSIGFLRFLSEVVIFPVHFKGYLRGPGQNNEQLHHLLHQPMRQNSC